MEHPEVPLEQSQEDILHHAHASTESWIMGVALTAALLAVIAAITALMAEQHESESHLRHHAVLSRSLTMFQMGIAIGAIAVLTKRKRFWMASLGFGLVGLLFFLWGIVVS